MGKVFHSIEPDNPDASYPPCDQRKWATQAGSVAMVCRTWLPHLVGVYVHGSAALGGFSPSSDLDVLVVADENGNAGWSHLGEQLLSDCGGPRALELSVVDAGAALHPSAPWPYELHVNSAESRYGLGEGRGDPDLIAHYAVARAAGVVISGPPVDSVFGPVSKSELLGYFRDELQSGVASGDQRYAVLNTCRAVAYAKTERLISKVDGGLWWISQYGEQALVEEALTAQEQGRDIGPSTSEAKAFVVEGSKIL